MSIFARLFGPRIRCQECGKNYRPKLEDDPLPDGGVLRRFACPHCGTQNLVARITARGVSLSMEIAAIDLSDRTARDRIRKLQKLMKHEVFRP